MMRSGNLHAVTDPEAARCELDGFSLRHLREIHVDVEVRLASGTATERERIRKTLARESREALAASGFVVAPSTSRILVSCTAGTTRLPGGAILTLVRTGVTLRELVRLERLGRDAWIEAATWGSPPETGILVGAAPASAIEEVARLRASEVLGQLLRLAAVAS